MTLFAKIPPWPSGPSHECDVVAARRSIASSRSPTTVLLCSSWPSPLRCSGYPGRSWVRLCMHSTSARWIVARSARPVRSSLVRVGVLGFSNGRTRSSSQAGGIRERRLPPGSCRPFAEPMRVELASYRSVQERLSLPRRGFWTEDALPPTGAIRTFFAKRTRGSGSSPTCSI